uniref:Uncharacterized protein n=1 Tax=Anguilla anguilla TaxID=7936 RepID=A0A0E9S4T7_ANGAN
MRVLVDSPCIEGRVSCMDFYVALLTLRLCERTGYAPLVTLHYTGCGRYDFLVLQQFGSIHI